MHAPSVSALRHLRRLILVQNALCTSSRPLSLSAGRCSGHSKWSTIKHDKAKNDSRKSKERTFLVRNIVQAVKDHGPDPKTNPQLAGFITNATRAGMQKASIDAALLRGQGKSTSGQPLEEMRIEAVLPPVAMILELETDRKAQALQDLRHLLKTHGATQSSTSYMFEKKGRIHFHRKEGVGIEEAMDVALEAGALDVNEVADGQLVVDTELSSLKEVEATMSQKLGLAVANSEALWSPNDDTAVREMEVESLEQFEKLTEELEDFPGMQSVYTNLMLPRTAVKEEATVA